MRVVAEGHGCTTPRYAYIFYDVECDRSDFARLYSVPVLNRSPPSVSSRWFFVNKPVSCTAARVLRMRRHRVSRRRVPPRVRRMLVLDSLARTAREDFRPVAAVILLRAPHEGCGGEARLHHSPKRLHLL